MFVFAMKARKWLANGCVGFLASVFGTSKKEKPKLEDLLVVNEFVDIFPKDLLGLPLDREVMFEIEILLGMTPISKAPYCTAPAELNELQA